MWNLVFLFTGLIFIILLLVIFLSKRRIKSKENKIFLILSIINLIGYIIEIFLQIFVRKYGISYCLVTPLAKLYIIYIFIWFTIFSIYTFLISNSEGTLNDYTYRFIKYTHITVIILGIIGTSIMPIEKYYLNGNMYSYGLSVIFLKIMLAIYVVVWVIRLLTNYKVIKKKRYYSIIITILLLFANIIVQSINPAILIATFTMTYSCYIIFFTIENPDIKMAKELAYSKELAEQSRDETIKILDFIEERLKETLDNMKKFGNKNITTKDEKELRKELKNIQRYCLDATEEISGIIDVGKIESGNLRFDTTEYETKTLIDSFNKIINLKEKDINVEIEYDDNIPMMLYGNKDKLEQMFLYVYKFMTGIIKKGNLIIKVDTIKTNRFCKLKVSFFSDDILLEDYIHLHKNTEDIINNEYITNKNEVKYMKIKKIAEEINADILYEDNVLEFSIMQRTIDPYKLLEKEEENVNIKIKYFDASNKKLLIVSSKNVDIRRLKLLLRPYNIEIDTEVSLNGFEHRILGNKTYDLVLIDDKLLNHNKEEKHSIKVIKRFVGYDLKYIVMLKNEKDIDNYLECDFDDYIVKPINKKNIDDILKKCLK